jgi:hypothetical protein
MVFGALDDLGSIGRFWCSHLRCFQSLILVLSNRLFRSARVVLSGSLTQSPAWSSLKPCFNHGSWFCRSRCFQSDIMVLFGCLFSIQQHGALLVGVSIAFDGGNLVAQVFNRQSWCSQGICFQSSFMVLIQEVVSIFLGGSLQATVFDQAGCCYCARWLLHLLERSL